uniref:Uncharacterized protein n=1 Tax=Cannabis sativa TaxID=3483 RepID=A0A803NPK6_CANSA
MGSSQWSSTLSPLHGISNQEASPWYLHTLDQGGESSHLHHLRPNGHPHLLMSSRSKGGLMPPSSRPKGASRLHHLGPKGSHASITRPKGAARLHHLSPKGPHTSIVSTQRDPDAPITSTQ